MLKNKKKIIILSVSSIIVLILVFGVYSFMFNPASQARNIFVRSIGLNNIEGEIKSIQDNKLFVSGLVPKDFKQFSLDGYEYIEKDYMLEIVSTSTQIFLFFRDDLEKSNLIKLIDLKVGDEFSALVNEDILSVNNLTIKELQIIR